MVRCSSVFLLFLLAAFGFWPSVLPLYGREASAWCPETIRVNTSYHSPTQGRSKGPLVECSPSSWVAESMIPNRSRHSLRLKVIQWKLPDTDPAELVKLHSSIRESHKMNFHCVAMAFCKTRKTEAVRLWRGDPCESENQTPFSR